MVQQNCRPLISNQFVTKTDADASITLTAHSGKVFRTNLEAGFLSQAMIVAWPLYRVIKSPMGRSVWDSQAAISELVTASSGFDLWKTSSLGHSAVSACQLCSSALDEQCP